LRITSRLRVCTSTCEISESLAWDYAGTS